MPFLAGMTVPPVLWGSCLNLHNIANHILPHETEAFNYLIIVLISYSDWELIDLRQIFKNTIHKCTMFETIYLFGNYYCRVGVSKLVL